MPTFPLSPVDEFSARLPSGKFNFFSLPARVVEAS